MAEAEEQPTTIFGWKPPSLEDMGLESTALSLDAIQEAFDKAASAVTSAAETLGLPVDLEPEEGHNAVGKPADDGCVHDPVPEAADLGDDVKGFGDPEGSGGGRSCVDVRTGGILEEGRDKVVEGNSEPGNDDALVGGGDPGPQLGSDPCGIGAVDV